MFKKSLFIFRRDLRLDDNTALIEACNQSESVIPIFIFDERQIEQNEYFSSKAFSFMLQGLKELQSDIDKVGKLNFFKGRAESIIEDLIKTEDIDAIFFNIDYTPFSRKRDQDIADIAKKHSIKVQGYADLLLSEPWEVHKSDGTPYTVFTPFFKQASKVVPVKKPVKYTSSNIHKKTVNNSSNDYLDEYLKEYAMDLLIKPGRQAGLSQLKYIKKLAEYKDIRNYPAKLGTSRLSVHHKFGTVSIRETYHTVLKYFDKSHHMISELYWRDFFTHICYHFPRVLGNEFQEKYSKIKWNSDQKLFEKWCQGKTGFPIVDAAMHELNNTGYMHNRCRMIVASFLTKDLHLDWRLGEKYFATKLLDYDVAVNNGSWQWAASTGCDAQPYFRIFNPWLQQKKFDPDCIYIKKWLPELKDLENKTIHEEVSHERTAIIGEPIVSHAKQKDVALSMFQALK